MKRSQRARSWFADKLRLVSGAVIAVSAVSPCQGLAEEVCFGHYELRDGVPYAVPGEVWTFDHGSADPLEGWQSTHFYGPQAYPVVRWQTLADFVQDDLPPGVPIVAGDGMIWAGLHEEEAATRCYLCGLGYGDNWAQRVVSKWLPYSGGDIDLQCDYWAHGGPGNEYALVWSIRTRDGCQVWSHSENGGSWTDPLTLSTSVPDWLFSFCAPTDSIRVEVNAFTGRWDWSDENCQWDTQYGLFGVDNVRLTGGSDAFFDFEGSAQGWTNEVVPFGVDGSFLHVGDISEHGDWDSWQECSLDGNLLMLNDQAAGFSDYFEESAVSPIIDLSNMATLDALSLHVEELRDYEFQDPDIEVWLERRYYPEVCSLTGADRWSNWDYVAFSRVRYGAECRNYDIDLLPSVPSDLDSIQVAVRVRGCKCCSEPCGGAPSNQSPVFDNVRVCAEGQATSDVGDGFSAPDDRGVSVDVRPNPIGRDSVALLSTTKRVRVTADLYSAGGRLVGRLFEGVLDPGTHSFPLAGTLSSDQTGEVGSRSHGVYFLDVRIPERRETRKLIVVAQRD